MQDSNSNWRKYCISPEVVISHAMRIMDDLDCKLLIVIEDNKFKSLLSIGDIQRAIIAGAVLDSSINTILRSKVLVGRPSERLESVKAKMLNFRLEFYPIVNDSKEIVDCYYWKDLFSEEPPVFNSFSCPLVIMAGGKGTRMRPLTYVVPKPLIPIGNVSLIEEIMNRFAKYGERKLFVSVNYKADIIKYHLKDSIHSKNISYFKEQKPLGTAGSLKLIEKELKETFIVHNCDILIDTDYSEMIDFHESNNFDLTLVAALKEVDIPYGTVETSEGGILKAMKEKPELNFFVNSGLYVCEPIVLEYIPANEFFHITELIDKLRSNGKKVGVYPVSSGSWKDIGNWTEYLKTINYENE